MSEQIKLTPDQQIAVDAIKDFLKDPNEDIFTLTGVGGAGKTTCIREAIRGQSNVIGATISHSAKFVLGESLNGIANCITVAQLLGLKQIINEEGEISFLPKAYNPDRPLPVAQARILVIDECSMIDAETFKQIVSMKNDYCKVIFMGDAFQLPPIEGKNDSVTFDFTKAELNIPVRYTGPLADLGQRIRDEIEKINNDEGATRNLINDWQMSELDNDARTSHVNEDGSGYIFLNDIDDAVRIALKSFKDDEDPEAMRMIAYRNSSIEKINNVMRAQLYCDGDEDEMDDIPQFMPGELVICNGGYSVQNEKMRFPHRVIYNNQTFKVKGTLPVMGPNEIPSLSMDLEPHVPVPDGCGIYCLDWEEGRYDFFTINNQLKNNAKEDGRQWSAYYNFKGQWVWFEYAYALNSHKSQGRTFTDAIIFEKDIFTVKKSTLKSKLQALYVACTRAKRRIYIYNSKYRVDQSQLPESIREELGI